MNDITVPPKLEKGDRVKFVSPASTPQFEAIEKCKSLFESWGLQVEYGTHMLDEYGYLAGKDIDRLSDFNEALRDPDVKAIFATRGGKGAYRIAHQLDFKAARTNPKIVCGFSDITVLHLSLLKNSGLVGIHGPLVSWSDEYIGVASIEMLKNAIMMANTIIINPEVNNPTQRLTTNGNAKGNLVGGNLDTIATSAGWALPNLNGCILLLEGVGVGLGHIDRQLTMMMNSGILNEITGVAIGRFTDCGTSNNWTAVDVLSDRLVKLDVPILGGLPIGHDKHPHTIPIGTKAFLDADNQILQVEAGVKN